ncbi:MAG TPA: alanine--tRNA ligase [Candidatus Paceibacterota bacterium]|nr:alanine--tRNA ligase [Candidatus Paceibacterota bacterium]
MLNSEEIRSRFLAFFEKRGHAILPSAPLVPENDPSVLFNTAGMQPLVPYLLGEPHPRGTRLANSQKCVRTQDIEEVGDNTHDTFFEMLGNWSLGDYFKKDAIEWSYRFLTDKDEGLGLDPARLYVTVFGGNDDAPKDMEAYEIWKTLVPEHRIYFMTFADDGKKEPNWWSPGDNGPCGPDSEMFYDVTERGLGDLTKEEYIAADDRQEIVEIWNDVFMEYEKKDGKVVAKLAKQNVDTGAGLERLSMVLQKTDNVFATDLFAPMMEYLRAHAEHYDERAARIVADHIRTSVFMIGDGVVPANTDQGYILRRLLRRAVRYSDVLGLKGGFDPLIDLVAKKYASVYPTITSDKARIAKEIAMEEEKFRTTLERGMKEFAKLSAGNISGKDAFDLYQSYGFPIEMTRELAEEKGITIDETAFAAELSKHQELSRAGAEKKFKGGLADHSEQSVKYHTATHLLHQALRTVLGETALQKGSNITPERLRFDFVHHAKMTPEQIKAVEDLVNEKIHAELPVWYEDIPFEEAKQRGAIGLFEEKYGDKVRVYQIGEGEERFSLEFCGGPHVKNTSEIGPFKIVKEEAVSAGVRRIKAVVE